MNKPKNYKFIGIIDEKIFLNFILDKSIEIKDNEYNKVYNRNNGFDKCYSIFFIDNFKFNKNYSKIQNDFTKLIDSEIIEKIKKIYGRGKIFSLQLSSILPGGKIRKHYDGGLNFTLCHRIHIPIVTNKNIIFGIGKNEYFFEVGKMFELNNLEYHYVKNMDEKLNRLHLIIDYCPEEYVYFLDQCIQKKSKIEFY